MKTERWGTVQMSLQIEDKNENVYAFSILAKKVEASLCDHEIAQCICFNQTDV
jgi:hypothetical protein